MTDKKLGELIDLQKAIRDLTKVISAMERGHWIAIDAPDVHVQLPHCIYPEFKAFLQQKRDEATKQFEEA